MGTLALIWYALGWAMVGLSARRWGKVGTHDFIFLMLSPITFPLELLVSAVGDRTIWEREHE